MRADGRTDGSDGGSTRGPCGPKKCSKVCLLHSVGWLPTTVEASEVWVLGQVLCMSSAPTVSSQARCSRWCRVVQPSRSPCCVLLALSWNTTNENPSTDNLIRAINYSQASVDPKNTIPVKNRFFCCCWCMFKQYYNTRNISGLHTTSHSSLFWQNLTINVSKCNL